MTKEPKTIGDWEAEVKKCTDSELSQLLASIENLRNWEAFNNAFGWTRFGLVGKIIECEITLRGAGL